VGLSTRCWSAEANLEQQDLLYEIHSDYIDAGAGIITANTFATARFVLVSASLESRFDEINRGAITAARRAAESAERDIIVAASLSCLPPAFNNAAYPDPDTEYRAYDELCTFFAQHGVDLILLEMMQDTVHAPLACRAASASGLPFWIGVSCRFASTASDLVAFDTPDQGFAEVLDCLLPFDPEGVAIMHAPLSAVGPAIDELTRHWDGATGAYAEIPYSHDPENQNGHSVSPEDYASKAAGWQAQGVSLLGGCCGTTPRHIAALCATISAQ